MTLDAASHDNSTMPVAILWSDSLCPVSETKSAQLRESLHRASADAGTTLFRRRPYFTSLPTSHPEVIFPPLLSVVRNVTIQQFRLPHLSTHPLHDVDFTVI